MPAMLRRLALTALACAIAVPASAQLLQRKELSYAVAKTIAENALEDCKTRGFAVSVVVVDRVPWSRCVPITPACTPPKTPAARPTPR
jgi:hypothetical protein